MAFDYLNSNDPEEDTDESPSSTPAKFADNSANATPQKKPSRWRTTLSMLGQIGKGYAKGGVAGAAVAGVKQARKKPSPQDGNWGY